MSLLEAISPTARQLLLGCQGGVSKSEHHRVHAERADGQPLCGGGYRAKSSPAWQGDIGPVNCAARLTIMGNRARKQTTIKRKENNDSTN